MRSVGAIGTCVCLLLAAIGPRAETGDTPLIAAVRGGDHAAVVRLLAARAAVNETAPDGSTALHWAARLDRPDLVRTLLRGGADVARATRYAVTPLALAAINGNADVIEALLGAGADPNTTGSDGETVLMLASRTGRPEAVGLLVARGADVNRRETWLGETALMWAAAENNAEAVSVLAGHGADLDARSTTPEFPEVKVDLATMVTTALPRGGLTALLLAARQGAGDAVRALAAAGADLNAADPDGTTPLIMAIINAHYDVAGILIDEGADLNRGDATGMTPLYAAIDMEHFEGLINRPPARPSGRLVPADVVQLLLDRGGDPNLALSRPLLMRQHNGGDGSLGQGATPLMRAAKVSDVATMAALLENGADPSLRLRNQTTALMIAASRPGRNAASEQRTIEAIQLLVARGADINAVNDNGESALHLAVSRGDTVVRFLAEHSATLELKDDFGRTPLDVAMGVPGGGGRGRGRGGPAGPGPVRESTAALLRELMTTRQP